MDFDTKASNILVIFQMKLIFQRIFFSQHSYVWLNKKPHQDIFVKSHEWNFSYGIEMVQLIHIQYMAKYFIKCYNYLNII
jgi:hypothetical protein